MPQHNRPRFKRKSDSDFNWSWERAGLGAVTGAAQGFAAGGPWGLLMGIPSGVAGGLTGMDTEVDRQHYEEALRIFSEGAHQRAREASGEFGARAGARLAAKGLNASEMGTGMVLANQGRFRRSADAAINEFALKNEMTIAQIEAQLEREDRALTQDYLGEASKAVLGTALKEFIKAKTKPRPSDDGIYGPPHGPYETPEPRPPYKPKEIPKREPDQTPDERPPDDPHFNPEPLPKQPRRPAIPRVPIEIPKITDPREDPSPPKAPGLPEPGPLTPDTEPVTPTTTTERGATVTRYPKSDDGSRRTAVQGRPPVNVQQGEAAPGTMPVQTSVLGTPAAELEEVIGPEEMSQIRVMMPEVDEVLDNMNGRRPVINVGDATGETPSIERLLQEMEEAEQFGTTITNPNEPVETRTDKVWRLPTEADIKEHWHEVATAGLPFWTEYVVDDEGERMLAPEPGRYQRSFQGITELTYNDWGRVRGFGDPDTREILNAPESVAELDKHPAVVNAFMKDYLDWVDVPRRYETSDALSYSYFDAAWNVGRRGAGIIARNAEKLLLNDGISVSQANDRQLLAAFRDARKLYHRNIGAENRTPAPRIRALESRAENVYSRAIHFTTPQFSVR